MNTYADLVDRFNEAEIEAALDRCDAVLEGEK